MVQFRDNWRVSMRALSAALALAGAACIPVRATAATHTDLDPADVCRATPRVTQQMYTAYVQQFNARDDRYADLYANNIVFEHGKGFGTLHGPRSVVNLYRKFWTRFDERLVPGAIIIDNEHCEMAVELSVYLRARRNGVTLPSVPGKMRAGDEFVTKGVVLYRISAGKITHIRGAIDGDEVYRAGHVPRFSRALDSSGPASSSLGVAAQELSLGFGVMTRGKYLAYVSFFNSNDPRYGDFYDSHVLYTGAPFGIVRGRNALVGRFQTLHRLLREHIIPTDIVIDDRNHLMAVELINRLVALHDGVKLPVGTLNKGDWLILRGVVIYGLANGRISLIREPVEGNELIRAQSSSARPGTG